MSEIVKISEHITFSEATKSQEAVRRGIENIPNQEQLLNMQTVARKVFEPLREYFGKPVGVSSFFRSEALNKAVKGSTTSQHCLGQAIDIDGDIFGSPTNEEIFKWLIANVGFDQVILEGVETGKVAWVHVSYDLKKSRSEKLIMYREQGKVKYLPYTVDNIRKFIPLWA